MPGAHARGFNHLSIAICLVGGIDDKGKPEANFTPEQMRELRTLLDELLARYPNAKVLGHRDLPNVNKACPSFDVRAWIAAGMPAEIWE